MRESGSAVRVVIVGLDRDDYQDVFVRLLADRGVVEIYAPSGNEGADEPGELVATAPLDHTLIEWSDNSRAKYPPQG